ncbi:MAG TPA: FKBP-type peptidyl-prolyl cis-trans isomerase, partial [Desulfuromonadales bacterium]|nr:FKBP-type peptidyl-prolyl cis-trans isomerase [Desulfuromonadales bacterium]
LSGHEPRLSEEEMIAEIQAFQQQLQQQQMEKIQALAEENKVESEAFLKENAEKEGVVVRDSGLQYKVIEPGEGESPEVDSVVTVHYRGMLVDGTEFDSSYSRNEPATFPVNGVIPGWGEALPLMKEGAKWKLFIPADLAYGESGAGEQIGPNAALIFEVELLSIEEKTE